MDDSVCFGREWVEGVRVVYDDTKLSYEQLLDEFMLYQKPGYQRQYASVIFVNDKEEEKLAKQWIKKADQIILDKRDDAVTYDMVEVEPTSAFYKAEEYHQRYWEKLRLKAFFGLILVIGDDGPWFTPIREQLRQFQLPLGTDALSFDGVCNAILVAG